MNGRIFHHNILGVWRVLKDNKKILSNATPIILSELYQWILDTIQAEHIIHSQQGHLAYPIWINEEGRFIYNFTSFAMPNNSNIMEDMGFDVSGLYDSHVFELKSKATCIFLIMLHFTLTDDSSKSKMRPMLLAYKYRLPDALRQMREHTLRDLFLKFLTDIHYDLPVPSILSFSDPYARPIAEQMPVKLSPKILKHYLCNVFAFNVYVPIIIMPSTLEKIVTLIQCHHVPFNKRCALFNKYGCPWAEITMPDPHEEGFWRILHQMICNVYLDAELLLKQLDSKLYTYQEGDIVELIVKRKTNAQYFTGKFLYQAIDNETLLSDLWNRISLQTPLHFRVKIPKATKLSNWLFDLLNDGAMCVQNIAIKSVAHKQELTDKYVRKVSVEIYALPQHYQNSYPLYYYLSIPSADIHEAINLETGLNYRQRIIPIPAQNIFKA